MTTRTASGKSLVFYVTALEQLQRTPGARILALYPLKALGIEQEARWNHALETAGLSHRAGRIDGQVDVNARAGILRACRVVVMTPDVVHAWLLSNLEERAIRQFLSGLTLVIVDEVHSYTGVFGSHAAYLFRRLQHAMDLLGARCQFVGASATMARPEVHLNQLLGRSVAVVGADEDTSPRHPLTVSFMQPSRTSDFLTEITRFLEQLAASPDTRFICFVDSRKLTEHITAILSRRHEADDAADEDQTVQPGDAPPAHGGSPADALERLDVLPFRAGYESEDRDRIQRRLSRGRLRGVVSTSALELGIDIPHLNTAVLVGIPRSSTSLYQRIGRVGRSAPGRVVVVHSGDVRDEAVFQDPGALLELPVAEGALYLENRRIQYIHALCLARTGGEHDQAGGPDEFTTRVEWPDGFVSLCQKERIGEIPPDLQAMKLEAGEDPNHVFPIRDVEAQFRVELRQGPAQRPLGSLSHSQVMRETYPGAVYYYATEPYRVYAVYTHTRQVLVRTAKRYTTNPIALPTLVFPNLSDGVLKSMRLGELLAVDCSVQVREVIVGFKERRGNREIRHHYPLDLSSGIRFDRERFTRNFFTTGTVLTHPAFNGPEVKMETIASMLYDAFLQIVPYESRDVQMAWDSHRISRPGVEKGSRFLALYDQTYGSLRLSSRLLDVDVLREVCSRAFEMARSWWKDEENPVTPQTLQVLEKLRCDVMETPEDTALGWSPVAPRPDEDGAFEVVILPGSVGLALAQNDAEFRVESVFFSPLHRGVAYRGQYLTSGITSDGLSVVLAANMVRPVVGESQLGRYYLATGEIEGPL
jgi:DEAD/DEAH box helicase domain-containing protein